MSAIFLTLLLFSTSALARDVVECSARRGDGHSGYWSWREIDGRVCWYVGRPGKPKSELYWPAAAPESVQRNRASKAEQPGSIRVAPRAPSAAPAREEVAPPTEEQTAPVLKAENLQAYGQEQLRGREPVVERSVPPPPQLPAQRERMPIWKLALIILAIIGAASLLPIMRNMQWLTNYRK